jgi:hypothetical protein
LTQPPPASEVEKATHAPVTGDTAVNIPQVSSTHPESDDTPSESAGHFWWEDDFYCDAPGLPITTDGTQYTQAAGGGFTAGVSVNAHPAGLENSAGDTGNSSEKIFNSLEIFEFGVLTQPVAIEGTTQSSSRPVTIPVPETADAGPTATPATSETASRALTIRVPARKRPAISKRRIRDDDENGTAGVLNACYCGDVVTPYPNIGVLRCVGKGCETEWVSGVLDSPCRRIRTHPITVSCSVC